MSNSIIIRGTTYAGVPDISVPNANDTSEEVVYRDTSDASLTSGGQMLNGVEGYGPNGKVTGSIPSKSSSNMSVSGATVTAPAGYYPESSSKSVASGSAATPATSITATPSLSINPATGVVTASVSAQQAVTPAVSAGYVSAGTPGNVSVSGSDTLELETQGARTIMPGTTDQTVAAGQYLTGVITVKGDSNFQEGNIVEGVTMFGKTGTAKLPSITQDQNGGLHIS